MKAQCANDDLPEELAGSTANSVKVEHVGLTFSNGFTALKDASLDIPGGSFCTLLGSSGSGKTTLLRAIAGLIPPTSGHVAIGGVDVTDLPVQDRNIGFVFQNYALFPHMNVSENIEYPLRLRKWSTANRAARVKEILELIELPHAATRTVGQLSGGQQQRVAIGRALAYRPSVLLLDEPMGALDRRLRQQLGAELRDLQQRTGITTVYVTHDQEEAFILSDKIAVMSHGEILQYSTPGELYAKPRSRFVAEFLGEANVIEVQSYDGGFASTALGRLAVSNVDGGLGVGSKSLLLRPENIRISRDATGFTGDISVVRAEVVRSLFLGSRCLVTVRCDNGQELKVECASSCLPKSGAGIWIGWDKASAVLLAN